MSTLSLTQNSSREHNILTRNNFSVEFHENFAKIFGMSPLEANSSNLDLSASNGKYDALYIAKMILNSPASIIKKFSESETPLARNIIHARDFIENMKEYFRDPTYSQEAFVVHNPEFREIADYISAKLPKTEITRDNFHKILTQIH